MKKGLLLFYSAILVFHFSYAQVGEWTWMKGANTPNGWGVYGTLGVANPANVPGGRYESGGMTDSANNFWLFGGSGYDYKGTLGLLNDFWKYDIVSNNWTWMKGDSTPNHAGVYGVQGIPSPANKPGQRYAFVTWNQVKGCLWLWGGDAYNDLWKYDLSTNEWTWMTGNNGCCAVGVYGVKGVAAPGNTPGQRNEVTASWIDKSGNLWLFGGFGYASAMAYGYLNDLWMYNPNTNLWTWESGDSTVNQTGVYGIPGIASPANKPGARQAYCSWDDLQGDLWLFSGNNNTYYFNDLWKYDVANNQWTWESGSNVGSAMNSGAKYDSKCIGDSLKIPGRRLESKAAWTDGCGNLWTYGGQGYIGDLWAYSPAQHKWMWVSGDTTTATLPVYGVQGVSAPSNKPGARYGAPSFKHPDGSLWIFGGGMNTNNNRDNTLWRYVIDPGCGYNCLVTLPPKAAFQSSDTIFCTEAGTCIDFTDHSTNNPISWQWYFPGATPDTSTQQNPTNICYYTPGTYAVSLVASNSSGSDSITVSPMITFATGATPPVLTFSGDTIYCSRAAAYQWYLNGSLIANATDSFYVSTGDGVYAVQITDNNGCTRLSSGLTISVNELNGIGGIKIYPNPASQIAVISLQSAVNGHAQITLTNVFGKIVYELQTADWRLPTVLDVSSLSKGVYLVQVITDTKSYRVKMIKE